MADIDQIRQTIRAAQRRHRHRHPPGRGSRVPWYRRGVLAIRALQPPFLEGDEDDDEHVLRALLTAARHQVDGLCFDLRGAREPGRARRMVLQAIRRSTIGDRVLSIRPHAMSHDEFEADLIDVVGSVGDMVDSIVLPGATSADEVHDLQNVLRQITRTRGWKRTISIEVAIDSPGALMAGPQMVDVDDVTSLVLDAVGYAHAIGARADAITWTADLAVARQSIPAIAAAAGREAVDAATPAAPMDEQKSVDLAHRDALSARRLGYAARWIRDPARIDAIQVAWTPEREPALDALRLAAAFAWDTTAGVERPATTRAAAVSSWWVVRTGLQAGVLSEDDIDSTGFTLQQLERTIKTRD